MCDIIGEIPANAARLLSNRYIQHPSITAALIMQMPLKR